jgi:hypothetical protein
LMLMIVHLVLAKKDEPAQQPDALRQVLSGY